METKISDRIAKIIDVVGLNSNTFAKKLNVSSSVIYNILKGNNDPSYKLISKIIETFDVNPEYLVQNVTLNDIPILRHEIRHTVRHKSQKTAKIENSDISDIGGDFIVGEIPNDKLTNMFFQILNNDSDLREYNNLYLILPADLSDLAKFIEKHTNTLYSKAISIIEDRGVSRKLDENIVQDVIKVLSPLKEMLPSLRVAAEQIEDISMALMPHDEYDILWPSDVPKPSKSGDVKNSVNQT